MKYRMGSKSVKVATVAVASTIMATTTLCVGLANWTPAMAVATSAGGDALVTVTVRAVQVTITQINNTYFDKGEAGSTAVDTYDAKNEIHFKTDYDAHVQIVLGDEVLWQGDTKAGQPVVAQIDLGDRTVGLYQLSLRAAFMDAPDNFATHDCWLNYRAIIPSIIPGGDVNAPNTGMYVKIGGRIYSMSTAAFVLLLMAIIVFLLCTRHQDDDDKSIKAQAKARVKAKRKKKANII